MPRLDDLLEQAVGPVDACYTVDGLGPRRTRVRRQRRARVAIACALVAGLATGAVVLTSAGGDTRRVNTPPAAGVFPDASNTVLVLDDGYDGVTLVDLDRRVAVRRVVEGQRAGDQPYRLGRAGDRLIVGWDEIYAAPLAGGASKLLGHATIWVPAAEPGRIWTVDWPGGRIGLGNPTTRLLDLTGRVLLEASFDPAIGFPAIGIPGGLAFETQEGVALWDAATNQVTARAGSCATVSTFVSDSHGDLLAWCETECDLFHVTRLAPSGPVDHPILPPHGTTFDARNARFSPDGRLLATTGGGWITIVDSETGAPRRSFSSEPADPNLPPASCGRRTAAASTSRRTRTSRARRVSASTSSPPATSTSRPCRSAARSVASPSTAPTSRRCSTHRSAPRPPARRRRSSPAAAPEPAPSSSDVTPR